MLSMTETTKITREIEKLSQAGDEVGRGRTIYDASWRELILKNLVAGMSRAVGGLILNIVLLIVVGSFVFRLIWPQAQTTINSLLQVSHKITSFETNIDEKLKVLNSLQLPNQGQLPANPSSLLDFWPKKAQ